MIPSTVRARIEGLCVQNHRAAEHNLERKRVERRKPKGVVKPWAMKWFPLRCSIEQWNAMFWFSRRIINDSGKLCECSWDEEPIHTEHFRWENYGEVEHRRAE